MAGVCSTCLRTTRHLRRGMCYSCERNNDKARRPPAKDRYPNEYRRNRATILEDAPECYCGCGRPADTADHIIPREQGGGHGLDNLRPAHHTCNSGRRPT